MKSNTSCLNLKKCKNGCERERLVPDGVLGAASIDSAVVVQNYVQLQVSIVVVSRVVVGDHSGRDAQTAQD